MNTSIDVSVIVPCFKCASTVRRAVASIAAQTSLPGEVILVDDCSGDETLETLYDLKQNHPQLKIKVIALRSNRGPGDARNAGWSAAKHTYIAFLDADDSWNAEKLRIQYEWMKSHPEAALTAHACETIEAGSTKQYERAPGLFSVQKHFVQVRSNRILLSNPFPTRSVMLKRSLPQRFRSEKRYAEDFLLWAQISLDDNSCFYSDQVLAYSYKAEYGESGLSGNLWAMEKGELSTYKTLFNSEHLSATKLTFLYTWSILKFLRRLLITKLKQISRIRR